MARDTFGGDHTRHRIDTLTFLDDAPSDVFVSICIPCVVPVRLRFALPARTGLAVHVACPHWQLDALVTGELSVDAHTNVS